MESELLQQLEARRQMFLEQVNMAFDAAKEHIQQESFAHQAQMQEVLNQIGRAEQVQQDNDALKSRVMQLAANF